MTTMELYRLLAVSVERFDPKVVPEDEWYEQIEKAIPHPNGLYINTRDGKQYRLTIREVLRP